MHNNNPLGELSPQDFLKDYWQQRPLVVRQAFPGMTAPLTADELAGLSCEPDVNARIVIEKGGKHPWETLYGPMDEAVFESLPETHWTLLVNDVEKYRPELVWIMDRFRFIPEWSMDDLMISYAPQGGSVGPHLDQYDVFILQLQGHRRWQIHTREVAADNRVADTELCIQKDFSAEQEWLLGPGDLIYLPPGVSHYGVATDDNLTVSIGFRAAAHAEMLQDFVEYISREEVAETIFRDPQPVVQPHSNEITPATLEVVREVLKTHLRADHPDLEQQRLTRWFGRFVSNVKTDITPEPGQAARNYNDLLKTHPVLVRHPTSYFAFARYDQGALLFIDGDDFDVTVRFAEALCEKREVNVQDLAGLMTDIEKQLLLDLYNSNKLSPPFS